ncbi:MAG: MBOAT family protein [Erysipelotrichaceae bacterium]|nr:MBOAT family protein [Erysipelotrichaceae bacterium]
MIFSSVLFMTVFLTLTLAAYFLSPRKFRNGILFIMSLIFYAWGEPVYVVLMIFSTIVDYTCGYMIKKHDDDEKIRKTFLIISCCVNLGMLGFFKYSDFLITNINSLLGTSIKTLKLALPIGISFYTFQTLSYTIDVYLRKVPIQKNIIDFGCYVAMFPQLIAGPIVRYIDVVKELNHRQENLDDFSKGVYIFCCGLGKKILLANAIGSLWDKVLAQFVAGQSMPLLLYWLGIIAYAFQLYFDFSGYSDMAIGLGHIFGFNFPKNFNYPYLSTSITDFWRRWHMTLGTCFREYVYIPLGGNRVSKAKWLRNLGIVWFLTGFWHGANWNFIVWGLYFGVLLGLEKMVLGKYLQKLPKLVQWMYTIVLILISWCLFAIEDLPLAVAYIQGLFGIGAEGIINSQTQYLFTNYGILLCILCVASFPILPTLEKKYQDTNWYQIARIGFVCFIMVTCMAYIVDAGYNPFLYFRF